MFGLNFFKNKKSYNSIKIKKNKVYFCEQHGSTDLVDWFVETVKKINKKNFNNQMIKNEDDRAVYKINFKKHTYYFKIFQENSLKDKIKRIYRSHAFRAFKKFLLLEKYNFKIPGLFLAIENQSSSILITSEFGQDNMMEFLKKNGLNKELIKKLFLKLAVETANLYDKKMINSDPNLAGISIQRNDGKYFLANIDVDGIIKYPFLPKFMIMKNLVKWNSLLLVHIKRENLKNINYKIRKIFLEKVYENIKSFKSIRKADYINIINAKTVEQLNSWEHYDLIENNAELKAIKH